MWECRVPGLPCLCGQALAAAAEVLQPPMLQKPQCSTAAIPNPGVSHAPPLAAPAFPEVTVVAGSRLRDVFSLAGCPAGAVPCLGRAQGDLCPVGQLLGEVTLLGKGPAPTGTVTARASMAGTEGWLSAGNTVGLSGAAGRGLSLPELPQALEHCSPSLMSLRRHPVLCNNVFCVTHPNEQKPIRWAS